MFCLLRSPLIFFLFNDTATTELYTLSLHAALPISVKIHFPFRWEPLFPRGFEAQLFEGIKVRGADFLDRKSTRLNSSHTVISYAVFCLKKKR